MLSLPVLIGQWTDELIKYLYSLMNGNKDDIILDFFSGSASTAQAIMKMNLKVMMKN